MSPEQLNDQFRAAAALPPELNLAEATELFLTPPPPPKKPWYQNLTIMLSTFSLILVTVLSLLPDTPPPVISAFPISTTVNTPSAPVAPLPRMTVDLTPPATLPSRSVTPATTVLLPAAPPPTVTGATPPPTTAPFLIPPEASITAAPDAPTSPASPAFGQWEYRKKELYLKPADPQSFTINIALTPTEQQQVKNHRYAPTAIKRATGTLILQEGRRNGIYEFFPNTVFRDQLNAKGYGDASYHPDALPDNASLSLPLFQDVRTASDPKQLIWLRYFIANIDESYLSALQEAGYTNSELQQVWQLAIAQIYPQDLRQILNNNQRMFTDRPPLADFRKLYYHPLASWLSPTDSFPMPYADYQANYQANDNGLFIMRPPAAIQPTDSAEGLLFSLPVVGTRDAFQLETAGKLTDTLQVDNLNLLKVKGRIRLYLDESVPEGKVIMYKKSGDILSIKRRSNRLIIENECGADNVDVTANPIGIKSIATGKCAIMFFAKDRDQED